MKRAVCHFSCGTSSAVATKLALRGFLHHEVETVVLRIRIENEHEDNDRFAADCERWFDHPITTIASEKYEDCWDVWERERFLVSAQGARCTTELKKIPGRKFWRDGDYDIFGFHVGERKRARRFEEHNPELWVGTPLIVAELSKMDCHALVTRAGIELPWMYRHGYNNNNCIGCVKGGAGYWNKIRVDFPEVFNRMAALERELNVPIIKVGDNRYFLDELDPKMGRHDEEPDIQCGLFCQATDLDVYE